MHERVEDGRHDEAGQIISINLVKKGWSNAD